MLKSFGLSMEYGEHVRKEERDEKVSIKSGDGLPAEEMPRKGLKDASPYDTGRDVKFHRPFSKKSQDAYIKYMDKHECSYRCPAEGCENLPGFTYFGRLLQ
ncbi:uncharacterized protein TRIVIDRAFT_227861 [Trichoderma virens Gv29-8]|uniref:Uncharacterized protein n=1 Tax=Hypocrea virens (strain Gv29-8 / FGSC 10586) TaxID=413071 RepID=G9NAR4_HYPVG|nr:uncharacterized protein TRIVIDRAFT_227861 [Trichoderma virens Gv29-8]EHK15925.1 hypothetical protein TRIVIDRAFT_227861 [Trichoderma virens Gv29-8]UKZ56303.1 hypothetical protein TrVGV298_010138 [Trichoderma virens]